MTYDIYVGAGNWNIHHFGNNVKGIYSLKDADGKDYQRTRTETLDGSHFKQNQYPVTFRATYASEKVQIRNTVGFIHLGVPIYEQRGSLTYQPGSEQNYTFNRSNPNRNNSLAYQGSFFFSLPKQFSIDISPRFNYMHNNDYLTYSTSNTSEIVRNARENAYNYHVDAYLQKRIGQKHAAMLGVNDGDNINRLRYSGTNSYYDSFHNAFVAGLLGYQLASREVRLYADAGVYWNQSDINGVIYTDTYPFVHLNLRYSSNSKNAFSAFLQYANATPGTSQKSPDVLQDNEYMFVTGNPLLENSRNLMFNLGYTWMPNESLLYTEYRENIGTSSHPRINITATYTFGYGKKVQCGNEVGEQSGASSAIMK